MGLIAIVTLLSLLIQKELVTALATPRAKAFGRALDVAIVPLLMVFFTVAAVRVIDVLR